VNETSRFALVLGDSKLLRAGAADVSRVRRRTTTRRLLRAIVSVYGLAVLLSWLQLTHRLRLPPLPPNADIWGAPAALVVLFAFVLLVPMLLSARSPHIMIRPEHIDTGLTEVRGLDPQVDEVIRSLNVFLGYATFREVLGGTPRRGILFEGPPGTGKTYLAKAMAKQAGVPFLFAAAPAFQSMWFGMSNTKIRAFFKALRKAATREGGAIGFIEEIDAIGGHRDGGMGMTPAPAGVDGARPIQGWTGRSASRFMSNTGSGFVNELLIQMQSFDQPPTRQRIKERVYQWANGYLPESRQIRAGRPTYHNILLIAATNRADALDTALLRPGRFDRRLYFDPPGKQGRRDLLDYFLDRKAHAPELDLDDARERLAHDTFGYTPVMLEHLLDEALLVALRCGRGAMIVSDVSEAKLAEEIGLKQLVSYTEAERRSVATHEAGHATVAHMVGKGRRLEVLSIIKRRGSLGLLGHTDIEERFTRSRSELEATLAIAMGGMVAEELFLGESGTGAGADLAGATEVAALMIGALGMGASLISFEAVAEGLVASRNLVGKVLRDPDSKDQVEGILRAQKVRAVGLLSENRDVVAALRDELLARDELIGDEITDVIHGALDRRVVKIPEAETAIEAGP
jgi:cell division protease FtsH